MTLAPIWLKALSNIESELNIALEKECERLRDGKTEAFFYVNDRTFSEDSTLKVECLSVTEAGVYVSLGEEFAEAFDMNSNPQHVNLLDIQDQISVYEILVALNPEESEAESPELDKQIWAAFAKLRCLEKLKNYISDLNSETY